MLSVAGDIFNEFAGALNQNDATRVSDYNYTLSIFVSHESKQACSDWQQLVKVNQQFIDQLFQEQLNERTPKILKTLKLSKKLFFAWLNGNLKVKMRW